MGGRGSSSGKAGSNGKQVNSMMSRIGEPTGKQSTTQEEKIQAAQQPKSTATKQNTADIAQRKKNANAFDNVTAAKLNTMTMSQLKKLARKAYLFSVGKNPWDPQSESEALSRFDLLVNQQPKSSLKKIIMNGKKEAKNYK